MCTTGVWFNYRPMGALRSFGTTAFLISCTHAVTVNLIVKPSSAIVENQTIELNCSFKRSEPTSNSEPVIFWYKSNENNSVTLGKKQGDYTKVFDKRMSIRDDVLEIREVQLSDSGFYKSEVTIVDDNPGKNSDMTRVLFLDKPRITLSVNGAELVINCTSGAAYPKPDLMIYKNNTELPIASNRGSKLEHRTLEFAGEYFCIASNEAGNKTSEIKSYIYISTSTSSPTLGYTVFPDFTHEISTRLVEGDQYDEKMREGPLVAILVVTSLIVLILVFVFLIIIRAMICKKKPFKNWHNNQEHKRSQLPNEYGGTLASSQQLSVLLPSQKM